MLKSLALPLLVLCAQVAAAAQANISVTSIPPFGSIGNVTGVVSNLPGPTTNYGVLAIIHVDGLSFYPKPTLANPIVSIQPNGTFTLPITLLALDPWFDLLILHVVPIASASAVLPPGIVNFGYASEPIIAASLGKSTVERYGNTFMWRGLLWATKQAHLPVGPGTNRFNPSNVFIDPQDRLHLRVALNPITGLYECAEVILLSEIDYGEFIVTTETDFANDVSSNVTAGYFVFDSYGDDASNSYPAGQGRWREIDFEDHGPGMAPFVSQFVRQPFFVVGNLFTYTNPSLVTDPRILRSMKWQPSYIRWDVFHGVDSPGSGSPANTVASATYLHDPALQQFVPPPGRARFRVNLWLNSGTAPNSSVANEIIISDFQYSDLIGVFRGGRGVNPRESLTVLGGENRAGQAMVIGIDNPLGTQPPGSVATLLGSFSADPAFPSGLQIPGLGMSGANGELLLSLNPLPTVLATQPWAGTGSPATFVLGPLPLGSAGITFHLQGLLQSSAGPVTFGLTDSLEVTIQP